MSSSDDSCPSRRRPAFAAYSILFLLLFAASRAHAAAPTLAAPPTPEGILAQGGKIQFIFDQIMSTADIDIAWEGTGIDPAQFTCGWVTEIFGIPIPAISIECTYAGSLPRGTPISYTLNRDNSGRIKNTLGEALPETSGSFTLPETPGNGCEPGGTNAPIPLITLSKQSNYRQTGNADPVFDPEWGGVVQASVLLTTNQDPDLVVSAQLIKPDGSAIALKKLEFENPGLPGFSVFPPSFFLSESDPPEIDPPTFPSEAELNAAYPNGAYAMRVVLSTEGERTVNLALTPAVDVPIPKVTNADALQNLDPAQPVTIQWNALTGASSNDFITITIAESDGSVVFFAPDPCNGIALAPTDTAITLPAGTLEAATSYIVTVEFSRNTHHGEGTIPEFQDLANLSRATRLAIGVPDTGGETSLDLGDLRIQTDGSIVFTVQGTMNAADTAVVEGTTDFEQWETVSTVSKTALDAAGGSIDVTDPVPAASLPPYKFYRIRID